LWTRSLSASRDRVPGSGVATAAGRAYSRPSSLQTQTAALGHALAGGSASALILAALGGPLFDLRKSCVARADDGLQDQGESITHWRALNEPDSNATVIDSPDDRTQTQRSGRVVHLEIEFFAVDWGRRSQLRAAFGYIHYNTANFVFYTQAACNQDDLSRRVYLNTRPLSLFYIPRAHDVYSPERQRQ
jgi:hypothetical protein